MSNPRIPQQPHRGERPRLSKLLEFRPKIAAAFFLIIGAPVQTGKE
jgi:hypothetical protein